MVRLGILLWSKRFKRIVHVEFDLIRACALKRHSQNVRPIANVDLYTAKQKEKGAELRKVSYILNIG